MRVEIIKNVKVEGRSFKPGDCPELPEKTAELLMRTGSAARMGASATEKRSLSSAVELAANNVDRDVRKR